MFNKDAGLEFYSLICILINEVVSLPDVGSVVGVLVIVVVVFLVADMMVVCSVKRTLT